MSLWDRTGQGGRFQGSSGALPGVRWARAARACVFNANQGVNYREALGGQSRSGLYAAAQGPKGHVQVTVGSGRDQYRKAKGWLPLERSGQRKWVEQKGAPREKKPPGRCPCAPRRLLPGSAFAASYLRPHPEIKLRAGEAGAAQTCKRGLSSSFPAPPGGGWAGLPRPLGELWGLPARQVGVPTAEGL